MNKKIGTHVYICIVYIVIVLYSFLIFGVFLGGGVVGRGTQNTSGVGPLVLESVILDDFVISLRSLHK